jgi:hypothetical protein
VCHVLQLYNSLEVKKNFFWTCLYKLGTNYESGAFYLILTGTAMFSQSVNKHTMTKGAANIIAC